jgi:hypothetical protein
MEAGKYLTEPVTEVVGRKRAEWFSAILSRGAFLSGSDSTRRFFVFVCINNLFAFH